MNGLIAGLIAGIGAWLADFFLWTKVFTKGMDQFATPRSPKEIKKMMAANVPKSAGLALIFGVLLAWFYVRFRGGLWVQGGGVLAGMEFATVLWVPTIALSTIGAGVWYDRVGLSTGRPFGRGASA